MMIHQRKSKGIKVTQKLKIELQSLISYACWDHKDVLLAGKTTTQPLIQKQMYKLYFPPMKSRKSNRVSMVKMFLTAKGRFEPLFKCIERSDNEPSTDATKLVLPELLHSILDIIFSVGKQINLQMLTSKPLRIDKI